MSDIIKDINKRLAEESLQENPNVFSPLFQTPQADKKISVKPPQNIHPMNKRPILDNGDGSFSTEESVTLQHPLLNGGKPTNVPSIWGGKRFESEDDIVEQALASGQQFNSFDTIELAVKAAEARSNKLGTGLEDVGEDDKVSPLFDQPDTGYKPIAVKPPEEGAIPFALQEQREIDASQQTMKEQSVAIFEDAWTVQAYNKFKDRYNRTEEDESFFSLHLKADNDPAYNKHDHVQDLIKDVPPEYHADILEENSLSAALRKKGQILGNLDRETEASKQKNGAIYRLTGEAVMSGEVAVDLAMGGTYRMAKTAHQLKKMGRLGRIEKKLYDSAKLTSTSALTGAAGRLLTDETASVHDETANVLMSLAGAVIVYPAIASKMTEVQNSFVKQVAEADEALDATVNLNSMKNESAAPRKPFSVKLDDTDINFNGDSKPDQSGSLGAASINVTRTAAKSDEVKAAGENVSPEMAEIMDHAHDYNWNNGFYDRRKDVEDHNWTKLIAGSSWMNYGIGAGFQTKMYNSKSATMNWLGGVVFESASGLNRGTRTAAADVENYHRLIQTQFQVYDGAVEEWTRKTGNAADRGFGNIGPSVEGKTKFNRELMLERNARLHERTYSTDPDIRLAADGLDNTAEVSLRVGRGEVGEHAVDGFADIVDNAKTRHYQPLKWSGPKINDLIRRGVIKMRDAETALEQSYRAAGMNVGKDARQVAKAVLSRAKAQTDEIDTSLHSLLQGDGKEFLREVLAVNGLGKAEIEGIMTRLIGDTMERGKEGFAKMRNEIDMETVIPTRDGSNLQIVDLLSNDIGKDWQSYTRRISGAAALARTGITNRAKRHDVVAAIHAEQRAAGEELTPKNEILAMFTHFDGGAVKGYGLGVKEMTEAGPMVAYAKRAVQLAWLGKMGLTQLGETGMMIQQQGVKEFLERSKMVNLINNAGPEALDDLAFITGEIGKDHRFFAEHLNIDEMGRIDRGDFMNRVMQGVDRASEIAGYASMFNHVRSWQQRMAALGGADYAFRHIDDALNSAGGMSEEIAGRLWNDMGIDAEMVRELGQEIANGNVTFKTINGRKFVDRLHIDAWDNTELAHKFGAAMTRNINQMVQKSMAGETDTWMNTTLGSILTHLKTFPMQAVHKQFGRLFRQGRTEASAYMMWSLGTAGVASVLRETMSPTGRDMDTADHAKRAFEYSNMTGWMPMAIDPLMHMMGQDNLRFNQFNPNTTIMPPILSYANDVFNLPPALYAAAKGTADYNDRSAIRAIPGASLLGISDILKHTASRNN